MTFKNILYGKHIVIIDDDINYSKSIVNFLEDYNVRVVSFNAGSDYLSYINEKSNEIDLAIVDLNMPDYHGKELIKETKKLGLEFPLLVISATGNLNEAVEAIREGAYDFISKPIIDFNELELALNRALHQYQIEKELEDYRINLEKLVEVRTKDLLDLNEKLKDEVSLREKAEVKVKAGSLNVIKAVDNARSELSKELHDSVGQRLMLTKLNLELLEKKYGSEDLINSAKENLIEAADEISRIVRFLYPQSIDKYSLNKNIELLVATFNRNSEFNTKLLISGECKELSRDLKLNIFRVIQEALSNIAKHSKASMALIKIDFFDYKISVSIEDNGIGINSNNNTTNFGSGLFTMQERIDLFNGKFYLDSKKNIGTKIMFEIENESSSC